MWVVWVVCYGRKFVCDLVILGIVVGWLNSYVVIVEVCVLLFSVCVNCMMVMVLRLLMFGMLCIGVNMCSC